VTWLIKLYPPAWRRRYGRELEELIAAQPASFATAIDLVAAAIDAWLNPRLPRAVAAADAKGARTMVPQILQLKCAGYGPNVTRADSFKAAAVTLGGTLALVLVWMWATAQYGGNPYIETIGLFSWIPPMLFGLRYTSLKGRPGRVQAVFIAANTAIVIAIALGAAWLNS
jgi:hypothetical protein